MFCRNCGKEIDDKAVVCVGCGVPPLKGATYCQNCGKEADNSADVCAACGVQLVKAGVGAADDKTMCLLAHVLLIFTWFVGPLIIWLVKGKESAVVNDQAKEALNFGITLTIAGAVLSITIVGIALVPVVSLIGLILPIMAAVQVNNGNMNYRYPFALRLIK
jgi:uncharacterized Tic20 family protein